jgi:hypothetical protein
VINETLADVLYRVVIASMTRGLFALSWCLILAHFAQSKPSVYLPSMAAGFLSVAAFSAGRALRHEMPNPDEAVTWYSHALSDLIVAWATFETWQLLGTPST